MFERIRKLLFFIMLLVAGIAFYNIYTKYTPLSKLPAKVKLSENGTDVKIEKFKVVHEVSGHRDWELKADHAEIDNKKNLTRLTNVQLEFQYKDDQTYQVSAENGTLKNDTKDFQLEGHVRLLAQSDSFARPVDSSKNISKENSAVN